jgi:hypothetical protein
MLLPMDFCKLAYLNYAGGSRTIPFFEKSIYNILLEEFKHESGRNRANHERKDVICG